MELCFGQRIDPTLGILEPWYTHGALDKIKSLDLSDKVVCEYGSGASTIWWANKAKYVSAVDHNIGWEYRVSDMIKDNGLILKASVEFIPTYEGDQGINRDAYVKRFVEFAPNIVVVDGIHRFECIEYAVKVLKPEILIVDNWWQDYVFICPSAVDLLSKFKQEIYIQPDHKEHEGNPWKTAIFYLNEK